MDDPHLIAGAAGGNVEALLEEFLIAKGKLAAFGGIHERNEDYVALVALKLRGISAENAVEFVAVWRNVFAEEVVDFDGLLVTDKRDHAKADGLASLVFPVFGKLDGCGQQRGDRERFLTVEFAIAAGAGDAVSDGVGQELHAAGITQRLDAVVVGNQVTELDDFRDAAEMLNETGGAAERLPRQIVDGDLAVVEVGVGNAGEVLEDEVLNDAQVLADGGGADLFVVADDKHGFAEIERDEGHDVALAGLVNNDHVKTRGMRIKIFHNARERHDPDGNSAAAFGHFASGLGAQQSDAHAVAFANAANGIEPADERLALTRRSAVSLRRPCAFVDEFHGSAAKLFGELDRKSTRLNSSH